MKIILNSHKSCETVGLRRICLISTSWRGTGNPREEPVLAEIRIMFNEDDVEAGFKKGDFLSVSRGIGDKLPFCDLKIILIESTGITGGTEYAEVTLVSGSSSVP